MADMHSKMAEVYSLEQLSAKDTCIHRRHPLVKMLVTAIYIVCVVSQGRYSFFALFPFLFYPFIIMALAEIPYSMIGKRVCIALPFCLFAGISSLLVDQRIYMRIGNLVITTGFLSLLTIFFRTCLCVAAILILVATTPFYQLAGQLGRMHVPGFFVMLLEMLYRYVGVLLEEAQTMLTAYRLRNPSVKWPLLKDAGAFIGQLFLRSLDRAERIYHAMQCRGYTTQSYKIKGRKERPLC